MRVDDLDRVERELLRMRVHEGGSSVRATTLNLVVFAGSDEHLNRTLDALQLIGGSRPLRAIVTVPDDVTDRGRGLQHLLAQLCRSGGALRASGDHRPPGGAAQRGGVAADSRPALVPAVERRIWVSAGICSRACPARSPG